MLKSIAEHFIVVTLNHQNVSVQELRYFSIPEEQMQDLLLVLHTNSSISEVMGLSTCNRTEFYAAVHSVKDGAHAIVHELARFSGIPLEHLRNGLDVIVDAEAVGHLFRLSSGLESMVTGDAQILGQVKEAYQFAQSIGTTQKVFHTLFPRAFSTAKRVRNETGVGKGRVSVSSLAVDSARQFFEDVSSITAVVIGAGKMGRLTAKYLKDAGFNDIRIVNRTVERSLEISEEIGGKAYNFDELEAVLSDSHLVISSTGAPDYVITREMIERIIVRNPMRRLLIDIALPPDIDPAVGELEEITLVDMDALRAAAYINKNKRSEEIALAASIVEEELERLGPWPLPFHIDKVVLHLGEYADQICKAEVEALLKKMPNLTDQQKEIIQNRMEKLAQRIILAPRRNLRTHQSARSCPHASECLAELFTVNSGSRLERAEESLV